MKKWFVILALFGTVALLQAQHTNSTRILNENIKTLQAKVNNDPLRLPVISLNGNDVLNIGFDEMSHESHSYSYKVRHCNADWTCSSISTAEYINGFDRGYIENYELSVNTTMLYTHYTFDLPNKNTKLRLSGNYVVDIYEDNNSDKPVAKLCFSVVEPVVNIQANVRGNTDLELNNTLQQIDFDIITGNYRIQDAQSEIKVVVRQNNRTDNEVTGLKPTYFSAGKLSYINNRKLIFEGGNEYHRFDFSSIRNFDERISKIEFERPYYHVYLTDNHIQKDDAYATDYDVNGQFVINYQNGFESSDVEADYMYVHLFLPVEKPFLDGRIYIGGEWNYNQINPASEMKYDSSNHLYFKTLLLKQGGYNYQYWIVPNESTTTTVKPIDGSHWQTQNQYSIFVYHRAFGERYDKLIGVKVVQ